MPAIFAVINTFDAGPGSLRQAVLDANLLPGPDVVAFDPVIFGVPAPTIVLTSGEILATDPVAIQGTTKANCKVSGSGISRVFNFDVGGKVGQPFSVSEVTITGGKVPVGGGAIYSPDEALALVNCEFTANSAFTGGAVQIDLPPASLNVFGCVFFKNSVPGGPGSVGGAINIGPGARLNVIGTTFTGNAALTGGKPGDGGAIAAAANTNVRISTSTFNFNMATNGGALAYSGAALRVSDTTFDANTATDKGGAIALMPPGPIGTLLIDQSTLSYNVAGINGGGIGGTIGPATSQLIVRNTTISGNKAGVGGGIGLDSLSAAPFISLRNSTVTLNETLFGIAGGVGIMGPTGAVTFSSTIIADNVFAGGPSPTVDLAFGVPTPVAGNNNLIGVFEPPTMAFLLGFGNLTGTMAIPLGAKLGPLAANGGPTLTHMPLAVSPAIDKGNNAYALATDQRGAGFPRTLGFATDIGAVEAISKIITGKGYAGPVGVPGGTLHLVQVTYYDDFAVDTKTLNGGDIEITTPAGLLIPVLFKGVDIPAPGTPRVATYEFVAPGGVWDVTDNGTYTIMQKAFEVFDVTGIAAPAGPIGTFDVTIPQTWVVNAANDEAVDTDGKLSLREAVLAANALTPSADVITFDPTIFPVATTIPLVLGELPITDSVTVAVPNAAGPILLDAMGKSRHFNIDNPDAMISVTIAGLTLLNGAVAGDHGGSILITDESVTLRDMTFVANRADPAPAAGDANGGAIATQSMDARLKVFDSSFQGNAAPFGNGGAIYMGTTFGNSGLLELVRSTVAGNFAAADGGGIAFPAGGNLTITDSTLASNKSGTGGGGLDFNDTFGTGSLVVTNSTFSGNVGANGGAIGFVSGGIGTVFEVRNSTLTLNESLSSGGGIQAVNPFTNPVAFSSTIIAGNKTPAALPATADLAFTPATVAVGDNNLIGVMDPLNGVILAGAGNLTGSAPTPLNPGLDPLAPNGGPTATHRLAPTSPAIGQGNNMFGLAFDQRGSGFPRVNGAQADIGAYEAPAPPTVTTITVNGGAVQRSMVTQLIVTFSEPVIFPNGLSAAFSLARTGPGAPTGLVGLSLTAAGADVVISFTNTGAVPIEASGSLLDGRYTLTIVAANIFAAGGGLDGNGNGAPEGSPADDVAYTTHRLFGDSDGDADVDTTDFGAFRTAFGGTSSTFDFDNDGDVDSSDYGQFRTRYGSSV